MNFGAFVVRAIACIKSEVASPGSGSIELTPDQSPVVHPLEDGLSVVYLVDEGDRFSYVQQRHLQALNVSATSLDTSQQAATKGLHEMGLINLAHVAQKKLRMTEEGAIHGLLLDGHFEASLMLLDDLWDKTLASYAPNGAVIAIPARDVLAFCDAKSAQGIQELQALVERVSEGGDHLLTKTLYQRVDGLWKPWHNRLH